jgi:hypothetical protein
LSGAGIGHGNSLELSAIILNKYNYDNKKLLFYNGADIVNIDVDSFIEKSISRRTRRRGGRARS